MVNIEPFKFQFCTAFRERVQLADKLNEIIDYINNGGGGGGGGGGGDIPADIQEQLDNIKARLDSDAGDIGAIERELSSISSSLGIVETKVNGFDSRITTAETKVNGIDTRITTAENKVNQIETTVGTYDTKINGLDQWATGLNNVVVDSTVERKPYIKLGGYPNGTPVRITKDVAYLDEIPVFRKVEKPTTQSEFYDKYIYSDDDQFYRFKRNIMIVCKMMDGFYNTVSFMCYKDQPVNNGTFLDIEVGYDQNNYYTCTHWYLPNGPYSSTMYRIKFSYTSSSVQKSDNLAVGFTWELYEG